MNDQAAKLRKIVKEKGSNNNKKKSDLKGTSRIITIASGKGGVGKSNITVNMGFALKSFGQKVLLLDGDLGMANLDILLGISPQFNLSHVLKEKCRLEQAIFKQSKNFHLLPGFSGVEDLVDLGYKEINRLLEISGILENNYDMILIDVGAGIYPSIINFIMASDESLIILTPEPTAVMDAYSLIKVIANNGQDQKLGIIINKTTSEREANDVAQRIKKVVNKYLDLDIVIRGCIPYDEKVKNSVQKQKPLYNLYPQSGYIHSVKDLAKSILNKKEEKSSRGVKAFMYRIVGLFSR